MTEGSTATFKISQREMSEKNHEQRALWLLENLAECVLENLCTVTAKEKFALEAKVFFQIACVLKKKVFANCAGFL